MSKIILAFSTFVHYYLVAFGKEGPARWGCWPGPTDSGKVLYGTKL
jgi:hypothetical protein